MIKIVPLSVEAFEIFVTQYQTAQAKNNEHQNQNRIWSIRTFVAVAIYTSITACLFVLGTCTLKTEKDNLYYAQRASIILRDALVVPINVAVNNILTNQVIGYYFLPQWENVGNTPALEMNSLVNFKFSRDDLPEGFSNVDTPTKVDGPASVGPKQMLNAPAFRQKDGQVGFFPQSCMLQADKFRFAYIWGWARYRDVFQHDLIRTTRFCWRIFGTMNLHNEIAFIHALCDEGNCTDESCDRIATSAPHPKLPTDEICEMQIKLPPGAVSVPAQPNAGTTNPVPNPSAPPAPQAPSK